MPSPEYISHAQTPEELKQEVCSDLRRRIATLDGYSTMVAKNASEKTRLARATEELKDLLAYWSSVKIERPKTKRELTRERRIAESREGISGSVTLPHLSSTGRSARKEN